MRRIRSLFLPLLMLALCACQPPRPQVAPSTPDDDVVPLSAPITVVTLNLGHDRQDWPRRQQAILDVLQDLDPDVVLLQDVLQDRGLPNQTQGLAEALGYRWQYRFYSTDPQAQPRRHGNAVLTRYRIVGVGQRALQPLDDARSAGFARLDIGGRPLNVYVTHLHEAQDGAIRQRQVEDLMDFVAATREGAPSLIGGDFNTGDDAAELQSLTAGYDSAASAHAGDAAALAAPMRNPQTGRPPQRTSHLFIQRGAFRVQESRIVSDQQDAEAVRAPDYAAVMAKLQSLAWLPER